ncbi:gamma-butyrobetaine dioxygenase-like isoform X1 [Bradysia coprophila]|uniref:gamma-butyrobetaine dioxygenase-like isoform X1 n=1 Tax=Bradysia coprophila TaxID=38358 RepID=UPI00187DB445|nr:gamma-butyrobetaine dioxygenase-like isoform X1 [Bradysia coprophila]
MFFNNVRSNTFVQFFTGNSKYLPKVVRRFNRTFYKSALCTGKINVQNDDKYVVLNCDDSKSLKYPIVWLRDNCQCKECFHGGSMSRIIDWSKFNVNVKIDNISFNDTAAELTIKWNDNHSSVHSFDWLRERSFDYANRREYLDTFYRPKKTLWNKDGYNQVLDKYKFIDLMYDNEALRSWLQSLSKNGVSIIENTPHSEQECRKLCDRVAFIRKTHYGEEFTVQAKPNTSNVAYLSTPLQLHTDLPYYGYKPGVILLHCLTQSQSSGGSNLLSDGFLAAERMKLDWEKYYEILTTTLVDWCDIGEENGEKFYSLHRAPIISLDHDGNVDGINYSVPQRDSRFSISIDKVDEWYKAKAKFVELIHEEAVTFKTKPGDIR